MMKKKSFGLVGLVVLVIVALVAPVVMAAPPPWAAAAKKAKFTDLRGHWGEQIIEMLQERNIITGYADGTFRPGATVTRAEALVMVMNALDRKGQLDADLDEYEFPDVYMKHYKQALWAVKHLAAALENDIISPAEIANFRPQQVAKRYEVAVWLSRALKLMGVESKVTDSVLEDYGDFMNIPGHAKKCIAALVINGIMQGDGFGYLKPLQPITRAEMAALIAKFIGNADVPDDEDDEDEAEDEEVATAFWGAVWSRNADDHEICVLTKDGPQWFAIETDRIFALKNGRQRGKLSFADILPDTLVYLELNEDDEVIYVGVCCDEDQEYTGTIIGQYVDTEEVFRRQAVYVAIETEDEEEMTFLLRSGTDFEGTGIDKAEDLREGMEIVITAAGGIAVEVATVEDLFEGELVRINERINEYKIDDQWFLLKENAPVKINGRTKERDDLAAGLYVEVIASGAWVLNVEAWTPAKGKVLGYRTVNDDVRLILDNTKTTDNKALVYTLDENALVFIAGKQARLAALLDYIDGRNYTGTEKPEVYVTICHKGDNIAYRVYATRDQQVESR
ncbi:MAG: S-layer homology domain-containing protein [bacterium]